MLRMLFVLIICLFLFLQDIQSQDKTNKIEHYLIYIKSAANGYITVEYSTDAQNTQIRKTRTALKTKIGSKNFDDQLLEESRYQNNLITYSWDKIWYNQLTEQQKYIFEKTTLKISNSQSGKEINNKAFPIYEDTVFLTDYFSFIPLLEKVQAYPKTIFAVDLKLINLSNSTITPQPLLIQPLGSQKLKLNEVEYKTDVFQIQWQNLPATSGQNGFKIWVESAQRRILQIQDLQQNMKICLATTKQIQELSELTQQSYFRKLRPLPYLLGQTYHYQCMNEKKIIGDVYFTITGPNNTQSYYEIIANGKFARSNKDFTFQSITRYDENYNPIFYNIKEGDNMEISCEFSTQGIKEFYQRNQNILEYFVPITPDTIFLDNSAIHHFAMFLCQANLEYNSQFSMSIFHPRRLQINPGKFKVTQSYSTYCTVELETTFHVIQMKVGLNGLLYEYKQDKILVQLMNK